MNSNVIYFSGWNPKLCIQLETEDNNLADFNRLLYNGFPSTSHIQNVKPVKRAYRDDIILQIKSRFDEQIENGVSHTHLYTIFYMLSHYIRWCDNKEVDAFTRSSLEGYMASLYERTLKGTLKKSTYTQKRTSMSSLFIRYLDFPSTWFNNIAVTGSSDNEPFESYTRSDLNQLLPFLRQLFNQTYKQFIVNPDKHIRAYKSTSTMIFSWKGEEYRLCAAISKMMCAATYLLAYYTYSNTTDLFKLKHPKNTSTSVGEIWYTMPVFKRRAFKVIQVEIGEHDALEIPKYSISFFDKLLNASRLINNSDDALLLQTTVKNKVQMMKKSTLTDFFRYWVRNNFQFTDQTGRELRPIVSRFRETGSQLTAYYQGELANNIMLGNTPQTRKQHYTKGNKHANNGMLQDTISIKEQQVQAKQDIKSAQEALGIKVLVIDKENKTSIPELSRPPNGSSCASPFGNKSKLYTKKAQSHNLLKEGEKLACADLLRCFGCSEQVIVQSVSDIWCLLSFRDCIEESLYLHLDAHHYRTNFEHVIGFINEKILPNLNKTLLAQAQNRLDDEGFHPLWSDSESVVGLISSTAE
ncbi:hypothetical protein ACTBKU_001960 [Vibrio parahaemolyticus]